MIFEEKTIILKDGRTTILKSPCVEDAEKLLNYIKKSCSETDFLARYPEEWTTTIGQEEAWVNRLRSAPDTLGIGSKEIYEKRKETIERNFGTAKEHHGMRYTQQIGREKMAMKVGLTFACLNMKKLARILCKAGPDTPKKSAIFIILKGKIEKMKMKPRKTPDDHTICPGFVYGLRTVEISTVLSLGAVEQT